MKKFRITNIEYDVELEDIMKILEDWYNADESNVNYVKSLRTFLDTLPEEIIADIPEEDIGTEEDIDDVLSDYISDETGWLVNKFKFEEIKEDKEDNKQNDFSKTIKDLLDLYEEIAYNPKPDEINKELILENLSIDYDDMVDLRNRIHDSTDEEPPELFE